MLKNIVSIEVITSKSDVNTRETENLITASEKRLAEIREALNLTHRAHQDNVAYHKKERQKLLMRIKRAKKMLDMHNTVTTDLLVAVKLKIS